MREITWLIGTSSSDIEVVHFFGWDFGNLKLNNKLYSVAVAEDGRVFIWEGDTLCVFPNLDEAEGEFGNVIKAFGVREYFEHNCKMLREYLESIRDV